MLTLQEWSQPFCDPHPTQQWLYCENTYLTTRTITLFCLKLNPSGIMWFLHKDNVVTSGLHYIAMVLLCSSGAPAWGRRCSWWSWERGWRWNLPPQPAERTGPSAVPCAQRAGMNPQSPCCPSCSGAPNSHLWTRKSMSLLNVITKKTKTKCVSRARPNLRSRSLSLLPPAFLQASWGAAGLMPLSDSPPSSWCSSPLLLRYSVTASHSSYNRHHAKHVSVPTDCDVVMATIVYDKE